MKWTGILSDGEMNIQLVANATDAIFMSYWLLYKAPCPNLQHLYVLINYCSQVFCGNDSCAILMGFKGVFKVIFTINAVTNCKTRTKAVVSQSKALFNHSVRL